MRKEALAPHLDVRCSYPTPWLVRPNDSCIKDPSLSEHSFFLSWERWTQHVHLWPWTHSQILTRHFRESLIHWTLTSLLVSKLQPCKFSEVLLFHCAFSMKQYQMLCLTSSLWSSAWIGDIRGTSKALFYPHRYCTVVGLLLGQGAWEQAYMAAGGNHIPPNPQLFIAVTPLPHTFSHPNWDVSL